MAEDGGILENMLDSLVVLRDTVRHLEGTLRLVVGRIERLEALHSDAPSEVGDASEETPRETTRGDDDE